MQPRGKAGAKLWIARVETLGRQWHQRHPDQTLPHDVIRDHMQMGINERAWARNEQPDDIY